MSKPIEICRQDEIEAALATLTGDGEELLRRAQKLVYATDVGALACAGGACWMELHDVVGKGLTLEAAIRDWRDAASRTLEDAP